MVAPSGEGAERCMKQALATVDTPVDYINVHGTSTPVGDVKELGAIRNVFADQKPAISSIVVNDGAFTRCGGAHEAIYSLLMLEHDFIAPSINIETLDEQAVGMNIVTETKENAGLETVMSNSFGFVESNASLVFKRYKK